ncbi:PAS domain-containing protein [Myxococcus sp. 1LA]
MRGRPVVTEPRSLREQLADVPDSLALLEGLFTHSPVPYAVFTSDGHCLLTNPAFLAMFGARRRPSTASSATSCSRGWATRSCSCGPCRASASRRRCSGTT